MVLTLTLDEGWTEISLEENIERLKRILFSAERKENGGRIRSLTKILAGWYKENPEELRRYFVDFEEKEMIDRNKKFAGLVRPISDSSRQRAKRGLF